MLPMTNNRHTPSREKHWQENSFYLFMKRFSNQMRVREEEEEESGKNRPAQQNFLTKNANKMQHLLCRSSELLKLAIIQR